MLSVLYHQLFLIVLLEPFARQCWVANRDNAVISEPKLDYYHHQYLLLTHCQ